MAPLTGASSTSAMQYAFQLNMFHKKKKPGKQKLVGQKADLLFAISYRSLLTQKIQEGLDASAKFLYLFGSYALQVGDIVEIAVLGRLGQHSGITAEDGIGNADKLITPEAAILGSKAKTGKQSIDIVAFACLLYTSDAADE